MKTIEIVSGAGESRTVTTIPRLGFGCMSLIPDSYKPREGEHVDDPREVLKEAHRLGIRLWDTADMYALGKNEELIGSMWSDVPRGEIVLATKCGIIRDPSNSGARNVNNSPEYIMAACEESLKRLKTDCIDIFYLHRKDPDVPIELPMEGLKRLVEEGKIRHIGLCEVDAETLRRAYAIHPVSVVQIEYSLLTREPALGLLETCRELEIKIVAYSPISRGLLTGAVGRSPSFLAEGDARRAMPRFREEHIAENIEIVDKICDIAKRKGCSLPQLCLAYLLHTSDDIIPIPGTKSINHLRSNVDALRVELNSEDIKALEDAAPIGAASGARYPESAMEKFRLSK